MVDVDDIPMSDAEVAVSSSRPPSMGPVFGLRAPGASD
jgi:hypothetical protein